LFISLCPVPSEHWTPLLWPCCHLTRDQEWPAHQAWGNRSATPALRRLRWEDYKFQANLAYMVRLCLPAGLECTMFSEVGKKAQALGATACSLHRWKKACTCSSRAPMAVARALYSGSLVDSGPRMVACFTNHHHNECSTSLRGEEAQHRRGLPSRQEMQNPVPWLSPTSSHLHK
jgi:hypothetical protein